MSRKTTTRKPKRKSGRKLAFELLSTSKCCKCDQPALETVAVDTPRGTKWKGFCWDPHKPPKKEV